MIVELVVPLVFLLGYTSRLSAACLPLLLCATGGRSPFLGYFGGFLLTLLIPTAEELGFRGYVINELLRAGETRKRMILVIAVSAFIFSAFHIFVALNSQLPILEYLTFPFIFGIVAATTYIALDRNILATILLHAYWNDVVVNLNVGVTAFPPYGSDIVAYWMFLVAPAAIMILIHRFWRSFAGSRQRTRNKPTSFPGEPVLLYGRHLWITISTRLRLYSLAKATYRSRLIGHHG